MVNTPEQIRRMLLADLRETMIPRVETGGLSRFMLAQPPIRVSETASLAYHRGEPLPDIPEERSREIEHVWDEENFLASRSPRLCCVLEGEVDWRIGITSQTAKGLRGEAARCDYHVLSMVSGTFFLIPPGVPCDTGRIAHWQRANQKQAGSRIFWMQISLHGVLCHYCWSAFPEHSSCRCVYLPSPIPSVQIRQLMDLLRDRQRGFSRAGRSLLLSLLETVEGVLAVQRIPQADIGLALKLVKPLDEVVPAEAGRLVQVACEFICANLRQPLTLNQIADCAGVSATHLNRCFRDEIARSTMQFVREQRMQTARALLQGSELTVQNIGEMVGYPNSSHFARVFFQMEKVSPLSYRKHFRSLRG